MFAKKNKDLGMLVTETAGIVAQSSKLTHLSDSWLTRTLSERLFSQRDSWGPADLGGKLYRRVENILRTATNEMTTRGKKFLSFTDAYIQVFEEAWLFSTTMMDAYMEVLEFFKIVSSEKDYYESVHKIFLYAIVGLGEKYLKHQTAYLYAKCLDNEPPPRPLFIDWSSDEGHVFSGSTHRKIWMRCVLRKKTKDVELSMALYHAKRVAPPMPKDLVQQALDDNAKALTEERPEDDIEDLKFQVKRTCREIVSLARKNNSVSRPTVRIPSVSACFEASRRDGGAFGELLLQSSGIFRLERRHIVGHVTYKGRMEILYTFGFSLEDLEYLLSPSRHGMDALISTRRVPILEPFKVRVVSMGEARPYQIARNYQRMLWDLLQPIPAFQLTGRPLNEEDIKETCFFARKMNIYSSIVSGDYTAATDNLHPELCEVAMEELARLLRIPMEDVIVLLRALTGHLVDGKPQVWGQLMGSPVSFPLLCILNGSVTRHSMEKSYGVEIPLVDEAGRSPFRVNGDDILFPLPPGSYQDWCSDVTRAGLSPSVGKNYISRKFAVLNSETYIIAEDWDRAYEAKVDLIPTLKLNLLHSIPKIASNEGKTGLDVIRSERNDAWKKGGSIRDRAMDLIAGYEPEQQDWLMSRFLRYNKEFLNSLPPVSWFVAEDKGGLGLPVTREVSVSEHHRRIAAYLSCQDDEAIRLSRKRAWLFQPTPRFSSVAREEEDLILDRLGLPWERIPRHQKVEDRLFPFLCRAYLKEGLGLEGEASEKKFQTSWRKAYHLWSKKAQKTRGALQPMRQDKSILPSDFVFERPTGDMIVKLGHTRMGRADGMITKWDRGHRMGSIMESLFETFSDLTGKSWSDEYDTMEDE